MKTYHHVPPDAANKLQSTIVIARVVPSACYPTPATAQAHPVTVDMEANY